MTEEMWKKNGPHTESEVRDFLAEVKRCVEALNGKSRPDSKEYKPTAMEVGWRKNELCISKIEGVSCCLSMDVFGETESWWGMVVDTYHLLIGLLLVFDDLCKQPLK